MTTQISAVVINLDKHEDRLNWFAAQAATAGLGFKRIAAVDASSLNRQPEANGVSAAELACLQSHRRAWETMLETGESHLAIFEDDVHLSEDIVAILSQKTRLAGRDLLKLECPLGKVVLSKRHEGTIANRRLHRMISKGYGAAGYVISANCAKRLLSITETPAAPVDVVLFDPESPLWREIVPHQVVPAACIQDHALAAGSGEIPRFTSSIESGRSERKTNKEDRKSPQLAAPASRNKILRYFGNLLQGAAIFQQKTHCPVDLSSRAREALIHDLAESNAGPGAWDLARMALSIGTESISGKDLKAFYLDRDFWPEDGVTLHRGEHMNVNGCGFEEEVDVLSLADGDYVIVYGGNVMGKGEGASFPQYLRRWKAR